MCVVMIPATTHAAEDIKVIVNEKYIEFDVAPKIINGRIMVPLRAIFERMGAEISWDDGTKTVAASKGDTSVILKVDDANPIVNGIAVPIDQPGVIIDGRVLAPLRFVAEAFGGTAVWNDAEKTAYVTVDNTATLQYTAAIRDTTAIRDSSAPGAPGAPGTSGAPGTPGAPGTFSASPQVSPTSTTSGTNPSDPPSSGSNSTNEYGKPDIISSQEGPLLAYVRFPNDGGIVGEVTGQWANETFENARYRINRMLKSDAAINGRIDINYDSYIAAGRYVGVLENGLYTHNRQTRPVEITQAFNFDIERGVRLGVSDIWDYTRYEDINALAREKILAEHPEAADYLDYMAKDDRWVTNVLIGNEGIFIILERGSILPADFGTLKILLPYADLGQALRLDINAENLKRDSTAGSPAPVKSREEARAARRTQRTAIPADDAADEKDANDSDVADEADPKITFIEPSNTPAASPEQPPGESKDAPAPDSTPGFQFKDKKKDEKPDQIIEKVPAPPSTFPSIRIIDPSKPMLALTFDDGPSKYTDQILNTLEKHNAVATFCVLGNRIEGMRDTVLRAHKMGCEIVGHSWDHTNFTKASEGEIRRQITDTANKIETVVGMPQKIYRPPYGAISDKVKSVSKDLGYTLLLWSVDPQDWRYRNADSVYNHIMRNAKNGSVILCHDLYGSTAAAMERVIPELMNRGYQLVTVSELVACTGGNLEPGKTYNGAR